MAFTGQAAAASCTASTQQSPSPTTVERSPSISKTCGQILAHNPHPIHSSVTFTFIFLLLLPLAVLLTLYTCLNKINTFFQNGTKKCGYNTKNDNFLKIAIVCVVNCTQALFLKFTVQKRLCPLCKFSVVVFCAKQI